MCTLTILQTCLSFPLISAIGVIGFDTHHTMLFKSVILSCDYKQMRRQGPIWKYIEWLDREGMAAIETVRSLILILTETSTIAWCSAKGDPMTFRRYLQRTQNSICGRHPIGLLLCVTVMTICPCVTECMCRCCKRATWILTSLFFTMNSRQSVLIIQIPA